MTKIDRAFLDKHYNENIFMKNKEKLLSGGTGDSFLALSGKEEDSSGIATARDRALSDDRMALVLLIRVKMTGNEESDLHAQQAVEEFGNGDIVRRIEDSIDDLRQIEPDLYYYPSADFHITVMDLLKGEKGREIPENLADYISCIRECAAQIKPFKIEFNGLTASSNAVMVRGYYDEELELFRQSLRKRLRERGLQLDERYETVSSHITIARIPEKLTNPEKVVSFVEKMAGLQGDSGYFSPEKEDKPAPCGQPFGTMTVDSFELSFHNWYDTRKEVLDIIQL